MSIVVSIGSRPVYGSETISVDNTSGGVGVTATKLIKAASDNYPSEFTKVKSALFTVETAEIRVNFDPAVTVTATTNGHLFQVGDNFTVDGYDNILRLKMIRTGSTASVKVTYFG